MTTELEKALNSLSPIQQTAVNWQDGAALVLAGPGAGKTRVLTTRIARLLENSIGRKFRILALTFTTKAAGEMRDRVELLVPGISEERSFIGTFHAFCTQILRQHGSHINVRPDFGIYGLREDQEALLKDAIQNAIKLGKSFTDNDILLLATIKEFKARLITTEKVLLKTNNQHLKEVYELYEASLRRENVMDFEGLILETCRLLGVMPSIGALIRQSYPYWMIDEFQDTTPAQYWLLHYLSGGNFKNVFVVADDDQIIYQWAGASYLQIEKFRKDYEPELIQLVENHRCPPEIVAIANQLVSNNTQRTKTHPTTPIRETPLNAISYQVFDTDEKEREAVAQQISALGEKTWGKMVIIGRTRGLLESFLHCLKSHGIKAVLAQRRDNFISPQFVWLQACLDQALRPINKRYFNLLVNSANRICNLDLDPALLIAEAESTGESFCECWVKLVIATDCAKAKKLGSFLKQLLVARNNWKQVIQDAIPFLLETEIVEEGVISDIYEDHVAWKTCLKEIHAEVGYDLDLCDLIQGIALRSKEPPRELNTVALMTIHSAKGLEFEIVYFVGLAEGEMPSWQSCNKGDGSREMEEERRNCFVAITRTQEKLNLSTAKNYRNRDKLPSRFLKEMSISTN